MRSSVLLLSSMLCLGSLVGCKREPLPTPQGNAAAVGSAPAGGSTIAAPAAASELKRDDVLVGSGEPISDGQVAIVHYTGWLYDPAVSEQKGAKFDSSREREEPFRFTVGAGQVIKGWDEGVLGMQVGGQRRLTIPPDLGYGAAGSGEVPGNATLIFDVELLGIEPPSAPPQ
jgi:FKBP-type peptidyl-prolyl cis-trans isomerase